jgi:hypothetical protein
MMSIPRLEQAGGKASPYFIAAPVQGMQPTRNQQAP